MFQIPVVNKPPCGRTQTRIYLIQRFPCHVDAVDLQDLIVDSQQPRAFCQSPADQTRDEHSRDLRQEHEGPLTQGGHTHGISVDSVGVGSHLLHAVRGHPHAHAVTDVEAQGLVGAVLVELHAAVGLGQDVHVDDGGDLPEVVRLADQEAFALGVDGGAAGAQARQAQHLLTPLQRVGGGDQRPFL